MGSDSNLNRQREMVSIMEASAIVGVSRRTIYNWLNSGKLEFVRTAGGSVRVFADTLFTVNTTSEQRVRRYCHVGGPDCLAPAGGRVFCRASICSDCGEPTCSRCSQVLRLGVGSMRRVCTGCIEKRQKLVDVF